VTVLGLLLLLTRVSAQGPAAGGDEKGWFAFNPPPVPAGAAIDLRDLNEKEAGAGGYIGTRGSQFIHTGSGSPAH
jgi:hypothetical protein